MAADSRLTFDVFDRLPVSVFRLGDDMAVLTANRWVCDQLGTTPQQVIGRRCPELGMPDDTWRKWKVAVQESFATGRPGRFQFVCHGDDERLVEFRFAPDPVDPRSLWVVALTISEVRQLQKALREQEGLFRAFLDRVPAVAWLRDGDGRYVFLNSAYKDAFGVRAAERIGKELSEVWPADTAEQLRANDRKVLDTGRDVQVLEVGPDPTGQPREWMNWKFPFVDETGKRYVGGIGVDMTEQRAADERATRAAKLESLGLLAAGAAHDFNNLLTVILGQATMALRQSQPDSPVADRLRIIRDAGERAGELCEQMLSFAGRRKSTPANVDLAAITHDTARLARGILPESAGLHLDLPSTPVVVHADPTHLRQVVLNLMTNAADAMTDRTGDVRVSVTTAEAAAVLTVSDQGCGMPAEVSSRVFEPFFTTKSHGHGLGLAAVQGLVHGMSGEITVHSEVDVGSTFHVRLPIV